MNTIIDAFFATLKFICYPYLWIKAKLLGIDNIKEEICNLFNKMHNTSAYQPDDYKLELRFFDGFFVVNKKTGYILASSGKLSSSGYIDVTDFDIFKMGFFSSGSIEKMSTFKMTDLKTFNNFGINYENNKITSVENDIRMYVKFEDDFLLDEELTIVLSLTWNNNFELIGMIKKTYDDIDPAESKLYTDKITMPANIQDETTKIINDISEKKKAYVPMTVIS